MKKTFLLLSFGLLTMPFVFGQKLDDSLSASPEELHDMFMKKRKVNNIVGWTMVGTGITMILGGFATNVSTGWGEGNQDNGLWLSYLGGASTIVSIPLFISAAGNKRKAKFALKGETFSTRNKLPEQNCFPSMALIIQLSNPPTLKHRRVKYPEPGPAYVICTRRGS